MCSFASLFPSLPESIEGQIDDLIAELRKTIDKHERVLVTTLTKRMSEDLAEYLQELNIKVGSVVTAIIKSTEVMLMVD